MTTPRERHMASWLAARALANRLIAEQPKRADWQEWAQAELSKSPHGDDARKMLSDQLTPMPT